jgi:YD repeat-containing protein
MKIPYTKLRSFVAVMIVVIFTGELAEAQADADIAFRVARRSPCKKDKQSDLQQENIKGRVRSTVTDIYSAGIVPRGSAPVLNQTETALYDSLGNMTGKNVLYPKATYPSTMSRVFDKEGNVRTDFFCNKDTTYSVLTEYEYGEGDKLSRVSVESYQAGKGLTHTKKNYDKRGNCIAEILADGEKKYEYDDKGNCIKYRDMTDPFPENHTVTLYAYDENCRRLNGVKIGRDTINILYKYDERDTLTEELQETPQHEIMSHTIYTYDDKGNLTMADYTARGGFKKPNMIQTMTNIYEYDSSGNWTQKTVYLSSQEFMKYERRITYY